VGPMANLIKEERMLLVFAVHFRGATLACLSGGRPGSFVDTSCYFKLLACETAVEDQSLPPYMRCRMLGGPTPASCGLSSAGWYERVRA
jgi:hypothetical protein